MAKPVRGWKGKFLGFRGQVFKKSQIREQHGEKPAPPPRRGNVIKAKNTAWLGPSQPLKQGKKSNVLKARETLGIEVQKRGRTGSVIKKNKITLNQKPFQVSTKPRRGQAGQKVPEPKRLAGERKKRGKKEEQMLQMIRHMMIIDFFHSRLTPQQKSQVRREDILRALLSRKKGKEPESEAVKKAMESAAMALASPSDWDELIMLKMRNRIPITSHELSWMQANSRQTFRRTVERAKAIREKVAKKGYSKNEHERKQEEGFEALRIPEALEGLEEENPYDW